MSKFKPSSAGSTSNLHLSQSKLPTTGTPEALLLPLTGRVVVRCSAFQDIPKTSFGVLIKRQNSLGGGPAVRCLNISDTT